MNSASATAETQQGVVKVQRAPTTTPSVKNFRPLSNRVIVRPIHPEKESRGGIIIPDSVVARELKEVRRGIVVAMGPGKYGKGAYLKKLLPMPAIDIGSFVEYDNFHQGVPVWLDGVEHRAVRADDIIAVYEE